MGMYLNSISPYFLYKSEFSKPYFVDKSEILKELIPLTEQGNTHICITRPRRFGKTVMANMIGAFFGKGTDASDIFDKLKISRETNYQKYLNQHNIIYIDFSVLDDECTSYKEYMDAIKETLKSDLYHAYPDISFRAKSSVREDFMRIFAERNEKFLFIFDEWDTVFHMPFVTESDKMSYLLFLLKDGGNIRKTDVYRSVSLHRIP